jgi:hypothetical protein
LRRGLGQGNIVPAEELSKRIKAFDADADGSCTRAELAQFLAKNHVGGPWFCEVVAKTLWKYVEQRVGKECPTLTVDRLGRIINFAMTRGPRPEKRYEITPEGMAGYEPLRPLRKKGEKAPPPEVAKAADGAKAVEGAKPADGAKPAAAPARGAAQTPTRNTTTTPGRVGGAASGPFTSAPSSSGAGAARRAIPRRPGPRR